MPTMRKTIDEELVPRARKGCPVLDAAGDAIVADEELVATDISPFRRALFIGLGLISVAVGTIGVFVPGLPTTVFLLMASFFFSRSSPRLRRWLWSRPVLGESLRRISRGERAPYRTRMVSLVSMWVMITVTAALGLQRGLSPWILGLLMLGGTIGTYYLILWKPGRNRARLKSGATK